ncbi:MAG: hypothetical protein ACD_51C00161G0001 [uncultured bacterium]|nr:MAG: hypothetical protein ACD_51C00161G0001 [uncultured bacterium]
MPDFYCPSTLELIKQYAKVEFYKINDDFSVDKSDYFEKIQKHRPKIILNYSYTGFDLDEEDRNRLKNLCTESTIIIEDYAHKILHHSDIKPLNKNHFYIDSIRKHSPLTGCHVLNKDFKYPADIVDKVNFYKIKCLLLQGLKEFFGLLAYVFSSTRFYILSEDVFLKLDDLIGKNKRPTLGSILHYFLYNHLDLKKISNRQKSLIKRFNEKLPGVDNDMNYYPLFVDEEMQDELLEHLAKKKIFADKLWESQGELYNSFLILPLTWLIRDKDADFISNEINYFFEKYE